jgi:hypothetical protein
VPGLRFVSAIECEVSIELFSAEKDPYAGFVPYSTCELEAWLVVQVIVAEFEVIPVADTDAIAGSVGEGVLVPPPHVMSVIEKGGRLSGFDELKLLTLLTTGVTTCEVSFVSVRRADVSTVICTLPAGAFGPLKVTGRLAVRCRLKTTTELPELFENAKDCR